MNKNIPEKVCAVICNWNKVDDLLSCVESVLKSSYTHFDLVVVDNGSDPKILQEIKEKINPAALLIENPVNLGGAGGFNRGMRHALDKGIYDSIWVLDNDIIVDPNCLSELLKELRASEKNGVVGAMILHFKFPDTVQELGVHFHRNNYSHVLNHGGDSIRQVPQETISVDYVAACSLLVDVKKLREIGLMDPEFFLYYDDIEWCARFKRAGYDIRATPFAKVWHKGGGRNKTNGNPRYYIWRNRTFFFLETIFSTEDLDFFIDRYLIHKVFTILYIAHKIGKPLAFESILCALVDCFSGIRGKIKEGKVFPLDDHSFGNYFKDTFEKFEIISDTMEDYEFLQNFFNAQKKLTYPVPFYNEGQHIPDKLEQSLMRKELSGFKGEGDILILCTHILSEPNTYEERLHSILSEKSDHVYFMDQYSNFFRGYHEMRKAREEYHFFTQLLKVNLREAIKKIVLPHTHFNRGSY